MKMWTEKGIDGKEIVRMMSENEEDVVELRRLAEAGDLDDRESFGDDPGVWKEPDDE